MLFVGNLPYDATEPQLAQWFAEAGFAVHSVALQVDPVGGESRGFAFVTMDSSKLALAVRQCNGQTFRGRTLIVGKAPQWATEQEQQSTAWCDKSVV
jgi:cold-inducible RNA-binding protein